MGDEFPIFSPNFGKPDEKKEEQPVRKVGKSPELALPYTGGGQPVSYEDVATSLALEWQGWLRAWRVARGWSQFEAAKQTGLSLSTWIRWETKGVPELKKAKLKDILGRF